MAIRTVDAFLRSLEESQLLEEKELTEAKRLAEGIADSRQLAVQLAQREILTRWQAGQLLAGRKSFFIAKYKLIDLLGKGGTGSVYRARHTLMDRPVALKTISRRFGKDPAALQRFLAEARAIAALDHPNIVHAYNVDCEGDRYYLVMEFVEGQDLQRLVEKEGPLDFERAADYIRQAADGLGHAHSKGMIHCDVKPANLLVNAQGIVKVLDLGMARLSEDQENSAEPADKPQGLLGTVDYISPEQSLAQSNLDFRADIYSLGCTFYFLLTAQPPFPEGTLHERLLKHQMQEPRDIAELRPDTPHDLAWICQTMMAKDREERFQTAEEVSRALIRLRPGPQRLRRAKPLTENEMREMRSEPPSGETQGPRPNSSRHSRRWLVAVAGVATGLVLLIALAIWGVRVWQGDKPSGVAMNESGPAKKSAADPSDDFANDWPGLTALPDKASGTPETPIPAKPAGKPETQPQSPVATPKLEPAVPTAKPSEPPKQGADPAAKPAEPAAKPSEPAPKPPEASSKQPVPVEPPIPIPPANPPVAAATPPAAVEPFKDFPKDVDLPELAEKGEPEEAAFSPITLATIHSADVSWKLKLLGGDIALRGSRSFILEAKDDKTEGGWLVRMESPLDKGESSGNTARLWRDKESLMFQWVEEAARGQANYLRNCMLEVHVGGQTRKLTLRKPIIADPVLVDLQRASSIVAVPLDWQPEPGQLRLKITKIEGREGFTVEPKSPISARSAGAVIFTRKNHQGVEVPAAELRVSLVARRPKLLVDAKLALPAPGQMKPIANMAMRSKMEEAVKDLTQKIAAAQPDAKKISMEQQWELFQAQIWADDFIKAVHRKAKLHYRLFLEIDGAQVDLAQTILPGNPTVEKGAVLPQPK